MARIRTIKPEFFTSSDIVSLTPLARLFYVSLWCEADREGRLEWKPKTLKLRYLPGDSCSVEELAEELISGGLLVVYVVDGKDYAVIPSFKKHQVINNRESESALPTRPARVDDASARVKAEGRKEGRKGKEGKEPEGFAEFWSEYPKKVAKDDARKAFEKRKPDADLLARMLKAIKAQVRTEAWRKDGGQFIPYPATWLNDGRWEDELAVAVADTGPSEADRTAEYLRQQQENRPALTEEQRKANIERLRASVATVGRVQ